MTNPTNELLEQIARFQKLKEITGCSKMSSYRIGFTFGPWDDQRVDIEWGCYDVGGYNRHYRTSCLKENLIEHMKQEIRKMEEVVKHYECED